MIGGKGNSKQRRIFSLTSSLMLILSILLTSISIQVPEVSAGSIYHNVGKLDINALTDYGRILAPLTWGPTQTTNDPLTGSGFIGLVIDQDNYNHALGSEDIADSFSNYPYFGGDDLIETSPINMIIDDGVTQKSIASFQNTGTGTGDPNDILINQTVWTVKNKDWAILQWTLNNLKSVPINNVCFGLELPLSQVGAGMGLGGDSGDDVDGFDAVNNVYWAQDNGGIGTCIGFGSAILSDPITHYYSQDYNAPYQNTSNPWDPDPKYYINFYANDTWLYERIHAPNSTVGVTPGNRISTVGWNGATIDTGSSRTFILVIAINDTFDNMIKALKDAQYYYNFVATGFRVTEFSDDQSGTTPQRIEVYNVGRPETNFTKEDYFFSVDGGTTRLTGTWVNNPIPSYEYAVFTLDPGESIGPEGDTIGLYQNVGGNNVLVDKVSYGQEGTAPDPLDGESVARRFDATSASYMNEWLRNASGGPTWGAQNDVGMVSSLPWVVLNRVMFNPMDPEEGYVELMNKVGGTFDISGYRIICDDVFIVPSGIFMSPTDRFYVLTQSNYPLNFDLDDGSANGDNIYLYDKNGNLLDMVGWNSPHNKGYYMSRIPDGDGTYKGYNDVTSQAAGWIFDQLPSLMITEFSVDAADTARIELYNPRGGDKVLSTRWSLTVDNGLLTGSWTPSTVPSGGYSYFDRTGGVNLDTEGDTIGLYYTGSIFMDEVSFGIKGVAPDPLAGESTARYRDNSLSEYTSDWSRDPSSTFGWQNDIPPIEPAPSVILNEALFNPINFNGGCIVIINIDPINSVNVGNYHIVCDDFYQIPPYLLDPSDMLIITFSNSASLFDYMDPEGDNVYLYDNTGRLLDMVGWNSPHTQGMCVHRVPDGNGTHQGYNDTTSEAAGWIFNSPLQVLMTEISDDESAQAQIEVYNPWYSTINFSSSFTFESASTPPGPLTGNWWIPTAGSGGYAVFNVTSGLGTEGDTLGFYQNGILIEDISYGQKGRVPDPLPDESVERYWDNAAYTNVWERNWSSGSTFGAENDVPPANFSSSVVLNEVMFNPSASDNGIVELYLKFDSPVDISGYKIVGDSGYIIPDGTTLTPDYRFFYLTQPTDTIFFAILNSSGDNVYLYDGNGSLLDMVGWSSAHDLDKTMTRLPDGHGTADGFNDTTSENAGWMFNQSPNYAIVSIEEDWFDWCDPGYFVWYLLIITHYQASADYIDIIVQSENGWAVELYEQDQSSVLIDKESPKDGLPDTGLLSPKTSYWIWVKVYMPIPPETPVENTTVFAQASSNPFWRNSVLLETLVNPWVEPDAYIEDPPYPTTIYEKSAGVLGFTNETTITLNATGMRYSYYFGQEVIFILDSSGSMAGSDPDPDGIPGNIPFPERVRASWEYVDSLTGDDRGGYVDFDSEAELRVPLTTNYTYLKQDPVNGLWCCDQSGGTKINPALSLANQELITNGSRKHIKVEILLTDASIGNTEDDRLCRQEADFAAANGIIIFTIGLKVGQGPPGGADLLRYIANSTGGQYFPAPNASTITGIFSQIMGMVKKIAGYNPNPGTEEVMVEFVLEQGIEYINGTFQLVPGTIEIDPNPDMVTFNPTNTTLEWNWVDDQIKVGEFWAVRFNISSTILGANMHVNIVPDSSITYLTGAGQIVTKEFPLVTINVLPTPPTHPYITNVTIEPGGVNITWSPVIGAEIYEIYGGPSQTSLNLDLFDVIDSVLAPQTWWFDTVNFQVYDEYYYVVRALDTDTIPETRSRTSNTGGYYARHFNVGINTFSIPLEPFCNFDTNWYTSDMNADYIRYMDVTTHTWVRHNTGDGTTNNIQMKLGEGYEVKFDSQITYTFTGMPGAMIIYDDDSGFLGFDPVIEAKSLEVSVEQNGDVNLTWQEPGGIGPGDWYEVYYSNKRDGFFWTLASDYFPVCPPVYFGNNTTTHINAQANNPGARLYYMVVPFNVSGVRGSSTYSIGIWTEEYLLEYDTIGIPLKLSSNHPADWYCDNIPDTVGINYFIYGEQRWGWHSTRMPSGAYDPLLVMTEGYQISTSHATKFTFIGV